MSNSLQPHTAACQASLSLTLLEFAQVHIHWISDAIQPSHPLPPSSSFTFNLSCIGIFSNELVLHIRQPMYWSLSFSFSPSNEYSRLTSFRIDWFDLLAVQGTLKSLLWHHNLNFKHGCSLKTHLEPWGGGKSIHRHLYFSKNSKKILICIWILKIITCFSLMVVLVIWNSVVLCWPIVI